MRLVDNDEVIRIVREEVKDEDNTLPVQFRAGVDYVLKIIGELPTVEAIPVEWLLKRAELCTIDYANCLHYSVEAWQTEQKCMVNGRWKFPKDWEKENE